MDPRLLAYYERELQHLRDMGGEFARQFPKIAGRLSLDAFECADPYVERLLEGFAFLAGRVQLKRDAAFPRFTSNLMQLVAPHFVAPLPSMAVVQFAPDRNQGELAGGYRIPRGTALRSRLDSQMSTACEYRTAHAIDLWPLKVDEAEYLTRDLTFPGIPDRSSVAAGLRLRLRTTAGVNLAAIEADKLPFYLRGEGGFAASLYEHLLRDLICVVVQPAGNAEPGASRVVLGPQHVTRQGFDSQHALLPYGSQSFEGFRLLHEYFSFPQRFLFFELSGLRQAFANCPGNAVDFYFLFRRRQSTVIGRLQHDNFALYCSPAINLFPKRTDRFTLDHGQPEHHLVVDRQRSADYEIYSVDTLQAYELGVDRPTIYRPFYSIAEHQSEAEASAFFTLRRELRRLNQRELRFGTRTSYVGSEVYATLVDSREAPYSFDQDQMDARVWCTNRDLPLQMPVGKGTTDFSLLSGAPVESVRIVAGPTRPRAAVPEGDTVWRIINHLALQHLSLADHDAATGAAALREQLRLYAILEGDAEGEATTKHIDAVRSVACRPVARLLPARGPSTYVRGLEIDVLFDESQSGGASAFLFGTVLERFFAKHVSMNSFAETVIRTPERGEVMRWPATIGRRSLA